MAFGITLPANTEVIHTFTVDTLIQNSTKINENNSSIYISKATFDAISNPRSAWIELEPKATITIPASTVLYMYSPYGGTAAELGV